MNKRRHTAGTITSSQEDYLERIYDLSLIDEHVRSIDVARALNVSRASVNKSLGGLKDEGYIEQEPYGTITLTKKGRAIAKEVRTRHNALRAFLTEVLKVDYEIADIDACEMEHAISKHTADRLYAYLKDLGIASKETSK
ncbi:metal-dependent transcriptional regulator [Treponema denticola]|jgi:iron-dependent transcriptional regulator|uniref:metal-dependent transcriptional regulator n=1 Tax=Treponema denticola TaxID=158 RepID=UPI00210542A9|nr:metal-dependent transcriptional regulator [Treponema denticola]UTY23049.1 metal-dependent transcriptional regulator [Treponema denticola]